MSDQIGRNAHLRWRRAEYVVIYAWMMGTVYLSMRNLTFNFVHSMAYFVAPWIFASFAIQRLVRRSESLVQGDGVRSAIESIDASADSGPS